MKYVERDLFTVADANAVMYGPGGDLKWCNKTVNIDYVVKTDTAGKDFILIPGTPYVAYLADQNLNHWTIYKGGLMGECIKSGLHQVDGVLSFVRSQIPPHVIRKIQKEAGYESGYRTNKDFRGEQKQYLKVPTGGIS